MRIPKAYLVGRACGDERSSLVLRELGGELDHNIVQCPLCLPYARVPIFSWTVGHISALCGEAAKYSFREQFEGTVEVVDVLILWWQQDKQKRMRWPLEFS